MLKQNPRDTEMESKKLPVKQKTKKTTAENLWDQR